MPWFRFTSPFDDISNRWMVSYPAGFEGFVKRDVADRAEEQRKGHRIDRPDVSGQQPSAQAEPDRISDE